MAHATLGAVKAPSQQEQAAAFFRSAPESVLREVVTVTKVVGRVRTIHRGSVGSLIVLGVLVPPEA
jgi:hypothetical protein